MVYKSILGAVGTCLAVASFNANANTLPVLESRLGGLAYYDPVADLTWLADVRLNTTLVNWADANTLVANLDVDGVTGWRLPTTLYPDSSCVIGTNGDAYNCIGSELGNMFYTVLGGTATKSITDPLYHNANYDLFNDFDTNGYRYWSGTEYADDTTKAWYMRYNTGRQNYGTKEGLLNVWAVHSGDVALVPVPAAVWLFGSGLIGLVVVARRKA